MRSITECIATNVSGEVQDEELLLLDRTVANIVQYGIKISRSLGCFLSSPHTRFRNRTNMSSEFTILAMRDSGIADEVQLKLFSLVQVESPEKQLKRYEICSFHLSLHLSFPLPLPCCHFPVSHRVQLAVSRCGSKNPLNLISSSSLSPLHLNYSPLKAKWESERGRHHLGPSHSSNIILSISFACCLNFLKATVAIHAPPRLSVVESV